MSNGNQKEFLFGLEKSCSILEMYTSCLTMKYGNNNSIKWDNEYLKENANNYAPKLWKNEIMPPAIYVSEKNSKIYSKM